MSSTTNIAEAGQSLRNIWVSLGFGVVVTAVSIVAFGIAVKFHHPNIAPRCYARPNETIYNPQADTATNPTQRRGNPFLGWIGWIMSLSYDTMLRGVPGTGTRKHGMEGRMLNVNLDGIMLLRFVQIGFKVSLLTMVLSLGVVLPLNLTAPCYTPQFELTDDCSYKNVTDYQRTTLANIPTVSNADNSTNATVVPSKDYLQKAVWAGYPHSLVLYRMYLIAFMTWIAYFYSCRLLKSEWREALALRRVFYLEQKMWEGRKEEYERTLRRPDSTLWDDDDDDDDERHAYITSHNEIHHNDSMNGENNNEARGAPPPPPSSSFQLVPVNVGNTVSKETTNANGSPDAQSRSTIRMSNRKSMQSMTTQQASASTKNNNAFEKKPHQKKEETVDGNDDEMELFWTPNEDDSHTSDPLDEPPTVFLNRKISPRLSSSSSGVSKNRRNKSSSPVKGSAKHHHRHEGLSSVREEDEDDNQGDGDQEVTEDNKGLSGRNEALDSERHSAAHSPPPIDQVKVITNDDSRSISTQSKSLSTTTTPQEESSPRLKTQGSKENPPPSPSSLGNDDDNDDNNDDDTSGDLDTTLHQANTNDSTNLRPAPSKTGGSLRSLLLKPSAFARNTFHALMGDDTSNEEPNTKLKLCIPKASDIWANLPTFQARQLRREKLNSSSARLRHPWVLDPEIRDTVPNIELYSVLVGNIPNIPPPSLFSKKHEEDGDIESQRSASLQEESLSPSITPTALEWQLSMVSNFFDQCIPPSAPLGGGGGDAAGFSSSVAAVTIVPNAKDLAGAWRKWYAATAALRRLKYIRSLIAEQKIRDMHNSNQDGEDIDSDDEEEQRRNVFTNSLARNVHENLEMERSMFEALNYGPEQSAIYSYETAMGSVTCCPYGCCSSKLERIKNLQRLQQLEREQLQKVNDAHEQLKTAREQTTVGALPTMREFFRLPENRKKKKKKEKKEKTATMDKSNKNKDENVIEMTQQQLQQQRTNQHQPGSSGMTGVARRNNKEHHHHRSINMDGSKASRDDSRRSLLTFTGGVGGGRGHCFDSEGNFFLSERSGDSMRSIFSSGIGHISPKKHIRNTSDAVGSIVSTSNQHVRRDTSTKSDSGVNVVPPVPGTPASSTIVGGRRAHFASPNHNNEDRNATTGSSINRRNADSLRKRPAARHLNLEPSEEWQKANAIRRNNRSFKMLHLMSSNLEEDDQQAVENGVFTIETIRWSFRRAWMNMKYCCCNFSRVVHKCTMHIHEKVVSATSANNTTFAVVTFTSRSAAVTARHCLADGRGQGMWTAFEPLPVPPLADAPPFACGRGCCRPTTINIHKNRRLMRKVMAFILLTTMYIFSTFLLTLLGTFVNPVKFIELFPGGEDWLESHDQLKFYINRFTGLIPGLLQTLFLSLVPLIFTSISNFGSGASSVASAEGKALEYYWWFVLLTAFAGTSLATMVLTAFRSGNLQQSFTVALVNIAESIPTQQAYLWINTLIVRFSISLPLFYLLHLDTFILQALRCLGFRCCYLANMGGMNGSIVPYRIYVDSGLVFVCTIALSFVSPLISPFAFLYFLVAVPLMRRNAIFYYRPKYDGGGFRWPFLFEMLVSSMLFGQVLLAVLFLLKQAPGPAIAAIVPFGPTLVFLTRCRRTFHKPFNDAGLLQMSLRDNVGTTSTSASTTNGGGGHDEDEWQSDNHQGNSGKNNSLSSRPRMDTKNIKDREEFLKFLVDAHKAAYVPVCIAGDTVSVLTAEPARVIVPPSFSLSDKL